jgi:hypothetical protein
MKAIVTNIKYDTDGELIDLPTILEIDVSHIEEVEDVSDFISDEISNITGFCHLGFEFVLSSIEVQDVFDELVSLYDTADFLEDSGEELEAQKVRATLDLVCSFLVGIIDKK